MTAQHFNKGKQEEQTINIWQSYTIFGLVFSFIILQIFKKPIKYTKYCLLNASHGMRMVSLINFISMIYN